VRDAEFVDRLVALLLLGGEPRPKPLKLTAGLDERK